MMSEQRTPTAIDRIAEDWVDTLVELNPTVGTYIGRADADSKLGDYSPAGAEHYADAARQTLTALEAAVPADDVDEVTLSDLSAELRLGLEAHHAGLHLRDLNVIASPAQEIRDIFDLMATGSVRDWENISHRLEAVPNAMAGYIQTLREGIARGVTPARRQVAEVATQVSKYGNSGGFFTTFVTSPAAENAQLPSALADELHKHAASAAASYAGLAEFLRVELAPVATEQDDFGRDLYSLQSRRFLGTAVDLDETYEWGIAELDRMIAEQKAIASEIQPGASVAEAVAFLDSDPTRKLYGTAALQRWMQETSDRAVSELAGVHFDIPDELRALECMIAPTQEGGIYYTAPTDDFSRPGRMWWSVPEGVTEFDTWRELTTVYHEGVPGHHLQIGQAVYNQGKLNTWRRQLAGVSGHIEGWALYAERLMQQLGYLDDPADRFGMLDGQRMRAARVVLDIGVHLQKRRPDGGGVWTAEYAFDFLRDNVNMSDAFVAFEVNRYLGWAGQAPSYKVGQRVWEQVRDEYARREGENFDPKKFHRKALDLGGVGLDTLRSALLT